MMRKLFAIAIQLVLLAALGFAQSAATGDLHVTIRDPRGGLVTNATVSARSEGRGLERVATSNTEGEYRFLLLPPGAYTVAVEAPGFAKATVPEVGQFCLLAFGNPPGLRTGRWRSGGSACNVNSAAELVETQRTSSTDTITQRRIDNLPINGRNYINFALTDFPAWPATIRPALEPLRLPD